MSVSRPVLIGIAGPSASGKSTVAEKAQQKFGDECLVLSADRYYKSLDLPTVAERAAPSKDIPEAIDFDLLVKHVNQLLLRETIDAPLYSFGSHKRYLRTQKIDPAEVKFIIVESILVFCHDDLVNLFDKKIFVNTDPDVCLARRILRDINERQRQADGVIKQYMETVRPALMDHILPSIKHADLVITNNETVLNPRDAEIDMDSVYDLINKPVVPGTASNTGMFSSFGYDPRIAHPASLSQVPVYTVGGFKRGK